MKTLEYSDLYTLANGDSILLDIPNLGTCIGIYYSTTDLINEALESMKNLAIDMGADPSQMADVEHDLKQEEQDPTLPFDFELRSIDSSVVGESFSIPRDEEKAGDIITKHNIRLLEHGDAEYFVAQKIFNELEKGKKEALNGFAENVKLS